MENKLIFTTEFAMKKSVYSFLFILLTAIITSCSGFNQEFSSVSFQLPDEVVSICKAGTSEAGEDNVYTCTVKVTGDYNSIYPFYFNNQDAVGNAVFTIDAIPLNSVIRVSFEISHYGKIIYQGMSEKMSVQNSDNYLNIELSKVNPDVDYSTVEPGDIILIDGTICKADDYDSSTMKAAAVICTAKTADRPALGIGIPYKSPGGTENYYKYEEDRWWGPTNGSTYPGFEGNADGTDGYMNGNNAEGKTQLDLVNEWINSSLESYSLSKFPPFYYASKFGVYQGNVFTDGWFIPTIAECNAIYANKAALDTSLGKIKSDLKFETNGFWTANYCSTANAGQSQAYFFSFYYGYATPTVVHNNNSNYYKFLVIREFK